VYKRRVEMTLADARKYLWYGIRPGIESQVFREIDYAYQFYQAKPMVYLAYERIAFFDREDPELRVTFDMNVRARDCFLELGKDTYGEQLLEPGQYLMEVKIPGAMPVWMSRMLSELSIYPVSFSKYGAYYQEFLVDRNPEGVRNCA
ncbi:MAG: VTC domain-containing protein, partial [Clostridiales bacterium]|nr:VTC domain-containing protein [Clostridiales bacterium]